MSALTLSFTPRSNLVFSGDGSRLFVRSTEGDLWCVAVPRDPGLPAPPAERVASSAEGHVLAAGWVDGRLAVARIAGRDLHVSHGRPAGAPEALEPLVVPGAAARFEGSPVDRLDPYAIVWAELSPYEGGILTGVVVLRDGAGDLVALAPGVAGEGAPSLDPIARDVTCLASYDGSSRAVAFVGRVARPSRAASRRFWQRPRPPSPAVAELSRRGGGSPQVERWLDGEESPSAVAGYRGRDAGFGLVAFEGSKGRWTALWEWGERDVAVPDGHDVVGVLGGDGGPELVARTATALWRLSSQGVSPIAEAAAGIAAVACSLADPLLAWTSEQSLHFTRVA